eukprot:TRINITY_DN22136_c0_g1_i4.p1 TRINITY_DN22136_c0_g1~~TRINITY_DN22136_c0_g1_i4.p1  ORF type:complete len:146 (-),score=16.53 TRINITY_DN22136_c0_g1_i4:432-869(-)
MVEAAKPSPSPVTKQYVRVEAVKQMMFLNYSRHSKVVSLENVPRVALHLQFVVEVNLTIPNVRPKQMELIQILALLKNARVLVKKKSIVATVSPKLFVAQNLRIVIAKKELAILILVRQKDFHVINFPTIPFFDDWLVFKFIEVE